jgi:hypothetical protein
MDPSVARDSYNPPRLDSNRLRSEFKFRARQQGWTHDEVYAVFDEAEDALIKTILKYVTEAKNE